MRASEWISSVCTVITTILAIISTVITVRRGK